MTRTKQEVARDLQELIVRVDSNIAKHDPERFSNKLYAEEQMRRFDEQKRALVAQRDDVLAGPKHIKAWQIVGRDFKSQSGHGPYLPATRENLETCSDGELLDAFSWEARGPEQVEADWQTRRAAEAERGPMPFGLQREEPKEFDLESEWTHRPLYEALSDEARAAFAQNAVRMDEWRDAMQSIWDEADALYPQTSTDRWAGRTEEAIEHFYALRKQWITERRRAVQLSPEARENIIAAVSSHRPWGDDDEGYLTLDYDEGDRPIMISEPYSDRNYTLFAKLADVRNDGNVEALSEPRGIPEDASPEGRAFLEGWGVDGHSHTHFTLAELLEADFGGMVHADGTITVEQWEALRDSGQTPTTWSGATMGAAIRTFTPEGYEAWVEAGRPYVPKVSGRSWRDPHVYVTPELLEELAAGDIPLRGFDDNALVGGGGNRGVAAPEGEEPFGLVLGGGRSVRMDRTGEYVRELQNDLKAVMEEVDQEALATLRADVVAEAAKGLTPEQIIDRGEFDSRMMRLAEEADERLGFPEIEPYIRTEWDYPADASFHGFTQYTIPGLQAVADGYGVSPDEVRFIAFFDN